MPVLDSEGSAKVIFKLGDQNFTAEVRRGQIVHEAFHAALPRDLTHGHRLTFRTTGGDEIFADNFVGDIIDRYGAADLVTLAIPLTGRAGPWRNVGFDHLAITVADRPAARDFFVD